MRFYAFDIVLATDAAPEDFDGDAFLEAVEGPLFEAFEGDVSPAVRAGRPYLLCDVEADSLDAAIRRVLTTVPTLGQSAIRVEVEPEALAEAA